MSSSLESVFGCLHKVAAVQTLGRLSDSELLERFVGSHDQSAFTVLIERHGPMVLGVCRRALSNCHDAEDACQATFLVLVRKAQSLRKKASLGSWLHRVASRVTAGLKRDAVRRKNREQRIDPPVPANPAVEVSWREVQAVLDEELGRLPERYRAPLILCYLECLTRDEAAGRLGLTRGGLHGRLERGRDLLRQRLTRRGLALSAVLSAAALGEPVAAALTPTFVVSASKAAALLAAGQSLTGSVGANVLALTREVLKSMFFAKVKVGVAAALCAALLVLVGGSFASLGLAQDGKPKLSSVPSTNESDEDYIRRISKDLRGTDPTPTEVHFFAAGKEPDKRQKLIDLFIQERQGQKEVRLQKQALAAETEKLDAMLSAMEKQALASQHQAAGRLERLQQEFYKDLQTAKDKADVTRVAQSYLDHLIDFQKAHTKSPELPGVIRQIVLLYEAQGKTVEAEAWRAKLPKTGGLQGGMGMQGGMGIMGGMGMQGGLGMMGMQGGMIGMQGSMMGLQGGMMGMQGGKGMMGMQGGFGGKGSPNNGTGR